MASALTFTVAAGSTSDVADILRLYRDVAGVDGGLARTTDEISSDYVEAFVTRALADGILLVARAADGSLVGEIHAYAPGIAVFAHVLGDLTIAVLPRAQGHGVGRALFERCLAEVRDARPHTLRVELFARESNRKAVTFYESLGFVVEGRLANRIRRMGGDYEADLAMGWVRPGT
jgi:putative acetyltransferase